jgi:hypothetical protein
MLEQTPNSSDNGSLHQQTSADVAKTAAQKMLHCVDLHTKSTARDGNDKTINDGAITSDKASVANASQTKIVNGQILDLVSAGKSIPDSLKQKAIDLHVQSRGQNNDDDSGDVDARSKDVRDMKSERTVINSDRQLIQDARVPQTTKDFLSEDITAKMLLQRNEKQDTGTEVKYASADDRDNKINKAVIDALTSKVPLSGDNLAQLLKADNVSKDNIAELRNRDIKLEPVYNAADVQDQSLNAQLNDALKQDPYLSAARREFAGVPGWTSERNLENAEHVQHEKRRLHLSANFSPEQLRMAEIADMNKQLGLASWATKDQRLAREAH